MLQGRLYGLVNASHPEFIKVGYTSRDTSTRAAELSAATGVPTPFRVAFDFPCADVRHAETVIHRIMDERGWRVASNREFFRCSSSDVVSIVEDYGLTALPESASLKHLSARTLLILGDNHVAETTFEGACHALSLYRQAAKRGSLQAYERSAEVHVLLDRSDNGLDRAFEQLRAGCDAGNYYCYALTALLLAEISDVINVKRAWELFFSVRAQHLTLIVEQQEDDGGPISSNNNVRFTRACRQYIGCCLRLGLAPQNLAVLRANATSILIAQQSSLNNHLPCSKARSLLLAAMEWTYVNLAVASSSPSAGRHRWPI